MSAPAMNATAQVIVHPAVEARARELLVDARMDGWRQGHAVGVMEAERATARAVDRALGVGLAFGVAIGVTVTILCAPLLKAVGS